MSYLLVFVAISALIILHEMGHLLAAKSAGIPIARFSVGFGPKLWGFKASETEYWLSAIPCGGYVLPAMADEKAFDALPLNKRLVYAMGGPLANLVGAVAFLSVGGMVISGISLETVILFPLKQTWQTAMEMCRIIPMLFSQPDQLSGVLGIVAVGGKQVGTNPLRLLELCFLLNVNLAILNLLPIPPLDGGKIVMNVLERLYRPLKRLQVPLAVTGWALLACLMIYVTILDVLKIAHGMCA